MLNIDIEMDVYAKTRPFRQNIVLFEMLLMTGTIVTLQINVMRSLKLISKASPLFSEIILGMILWCHDMEIAFSTTGFFRGIF